MLYWFCLGLCVCGSFCPASGYTLGDWLDPALEIVHGRILRQSVGPATAGDGARPAVGDWSGDGELDLFVGSADGDLVYFASQGPRQPLGEGIVLSGPSSLADPGLPGEAPLTPALCDWDQDGDLDLLVSVGGRLLWCPTGVPGRVSSLGSTRPVVTAAGVGVLPDEKSVAAAADLNADGLPDLVVADGAGRFSLFVNTGAPGSARFEGATTLWVGDAAAQLGGSVLFSLADWDGDGRLDIIAADERGQAFVLTSQGGFPPKFRPPSPVGGDHLPLPDGRAAGRPSPAVADWDHDGQVDLLFGESGGRVVFLRRVGVRSLEVTGYVRAQSAPMDAGTSSVVGAGDLDRDGRADLVIGGSEGGFQWARMCPGPGLREVQPLTDAQGVSIRVPEGKATCVAIGDLDSDGDGDLVVGTDLGGIVAFVNVGGPQSPVFASGREVMRHRMASWSQVRSLCLHDWDRDGDLDLFLGVSRKPREGAAGELPALCVGDLVYAENRGLSGGLPQWWKPTSLVVYAATEESRTGTRDATGMIAGLAGIGHWDSDARRDFLLYDAGGNLYWFDSRTSLSGYPTLELRRKADKLREGVLLRGVQRPVVHDLDGDGILDLIMGMEPYGFVRFVNGKSLPH